MPKLAEGTLRKGFRRCFKCGGAFKDPEFYASLHFMYEHNGGRITVCKGCVDELFSDYARQFSGRARAFYYLCAKFGWYFDQSDFEKVDLDPKTAVGLYVKHQNLTLRNGNVKTFEDNLQEGEFAQSAPDGEGGGYSAEWGGKYTAEDLKYLNDYLARLKGDYKITTGNHEDYARKIAKASLIADKCFEKHRERPSDKVLMDVWEKSVKNFDSMSKSAKFTEATRGAGDVGLGGFGVTFELLDKDEYVTAHIPLEHDTIDQILEDYANINRSL